MPFYGTCLAEHVQERFSLLEQEEEEKNAYCKEKMDPSWSKLRIVKVSILALILSITIYTLLIEPEMSEHPNLLLSATDSHPVSFPATLFMKDPLEYVNTFHLTLGGPFYDITNEESLFKNYEQLQISLLENNSSSIQREEISFIPHYYRLTKSDLFIRSNGIKKCVLNLRGRSPSNITLLVETTSKVSIPLLLSGYMSRDSIASLGNGALYGGICLLGLYVLIIGDFVHRTTASMLVSLLLIGIMSHFDSRPSLNQLMTWLDVETLSLLFAMMLVVGILEETNFFAYIGYKLYKFSGDRLWLLIGLLCLQSALISSILDNVTTVLLLSPVIIQLCTVMRTNTKDVLVMVAIFSNIGGTATIIGDPPNVIIGSDPSFRDEITFSKFILHVGPIAVIVGLGAFSLLRKVICKDLESGLKREAAAAERVRNEIRIWERIYSNLPSLTNEDKKIRVVTKYKLVELKRKAPPSSRVPPPKPIQESEGQIKNPVLLVKSLGILLAMILLFFMNSLLNIKLSLSWIALSGAIALIVLADIREVESLLAKVEWSTLIFFACLFVIMGTLEALGLLHLLGAFVHGYVESLRPSMRLGVSICLILWVSGLASSFVDNIPFTTMMVPVIKSIGSLGVPLEPLIWALSLGTCLGGNGTLVGSSANLVVAGIARQHGHEISFWDFFKLGFPVVILSLALSNLYLLMCHVLLEWH